MNAPMRTIVFDIETVGENFDALDEATKDNLTQWLRKEFNTEEEYRIKYEDMKNRLGFSPLTGEVVALGILEAERDEGAVYFQSPGKALPEAEERGVKLVPKTEEELLRKFWEIAERCDTFVSFNGRSFDVPFLMLRSAIHNIRPAKDLMSNRYLGSQRREAQHVDLLDQMNFYGAVPGRKSLHLFCRAFGIESPKTGGVTGDDVGRLFAEGKFLDIARYNARDLYATRELYRRWRDYLKF